MKIILSFILSLSVCVAQSQIAFEFKEVLDSSFYQSCIDDEKIANEQGDPISKANVLYKIGRDCGRYNEDLSLRYKKIALGLFKENKQDSLYHKVLSSMTLNYTSQGYYDEAQEILENNILFWKSRGSIRAEAQDLKKLGYVHQDRGNYIKAIDYYLQCYSMQKDLYEMLSLGDITNRLVSTYLTLGDCKTATKYAEPYLEAVNEPGFQGYESNVMRAISHCYLENGQDSIGNLYLSLTSDMWKKSKSTKLRVYAYRDLSDTEVKKGNYDLAEAYLDTAFVFAQKFGNKKILSKIENKFGKLFFKVKKYQVSSTHFKRSLMFAQESGEKIIEQEDYKFLSDIASLQNDYKTSLSYFKSYDSLRQVLFSDEVSEEIKQLDIRIQKEQTAEEIQILEEQNRLKETNLINERKIKLFLSGLLLGSILLLTLIYFLYKQRANTNDELKDKNSTISKALKTNKMLLKEIHHRVKNNLQVVSSLLFLQSRFMKDESAKGAIQTGRSRVQAMSILHQKLYQNEDLQSVSIKPYFEDLSSNLFNTYKLYNQNVRFVSEIQDIELDVDTVIPMGLIANELISNSLKHAFAKNESGQITLKIFRNNESIVLEVSDNGKGFPFTNFPENSDSLGLDLIHSFVDKLEGEIVLNKGEGAGVKVIFKP